MKRIRWLLPVVLVAACASGTHGRWSLRPSRRGFASVARRHRARAPRLADRRERVSHRGHALRRAGTGRARDSHRSRARADGARTDGREALARARADRRAACLVSRRLRDAREPSAARDSRVRDVHSLDRRSRTGFALVLEALAEEPFPATATAIMRALNETFPNIPAGQYALARLALRSGDFELALTNAEAARQSNADWIEAQLLYARTLLVTGRTDDSLAIAAELAARHDEVEVQLQYAELLLSAGRPREAETRLNADPRDEPRLARGDSRARVPRHDRAARRRRQALLQRSARRTRLPQ